MLVVVLNISAEDGTLLSEPDLIGRGFVFEEESERQTGELRRVAAESLNYCRAHKITDRTGIKARVKANLSGYLYKTTKRSPMIIPVITEV